MKIYDNISVEIFLSVPLELIAPATPGAESGLKPTPRSLWRMPMTPASLGHVHCFRSPQLPTRVQHSAGKRGIPPADSSAAFRPDGRPAITA
jgi:hypothetical protein